MPTKKKASRIFYFLCFSVSLTSGCCWCNAKQRRPYICKEGSKYECIEYYYYYYLTDLCTCLLHQAGGIFTIRLCLQVKRHLGLFRMQLVPSLDVCVQQPCFQCRWQPEDTVENELMPLSHCRKRKKNNTTPMSKNLKCTGLLTSLFNMHEMTLRRSYRITYT